MSIKLRHPYRGYTGYKIWHKKQGRWYMCMVRRVDGHAKRKTISLARYRMSVHLGRRLLPTEHVDHIDEDKTNDIISNLQLLTCAENTRKSIRARGKEAKPVNLICPVCGIAYTRRKGLESSTCSRSCGGRKSSSVNRRARIDVACIDRIRKLHKRGLSSYEIAKRVSVARNTVMKYW